MGAGRRGPGDERFTRTGRSPSLRYPSALNTAHGLHLGVKRSASSQARGRANLRWVGLGHLRCSQRRKVSVLRTGWGPSVRIRMGSLPRKLFMVPE